MKLTGIAFMAVLFFGMGYIAAYNSGISGNTILSAAQPSTGTIQPYICPSDACAHQLISLIDGAKSSVHVMIYSLTLQEIADALVRAKQRGLDVRVLADKTQAGISSEKVTYLIAHGVPVKIVDIPGYGIFHHKVTIVDGNIVALGSFNYTENASERNAENLEIIRDPATTKKLEQEFQNWWGKTA